MGKQEMMERAYRRLVKAREAHTAGPSAKTAAALAAASKAFDLAEARAMFGEST